MDRTIPDHRNCVHCGSGNILPFEEDTESDHDIPLFMIIVTALLIVALYLAVVVTSYMYFPAVIFFFIIVFARILKQQEKKSMRNHYRTRNRRYICLDCSRDFVLNDSRSGTGL